MILSILGGCAAVLSPGIGGALAIGFLVGLLKIYFFSEAEEDTATTLIGMAIGALVAIILQHA